MNYSAQILPAGAFTMANDRSHQAGLRGDVCAE
jgi:hypothetical protein